MSIKYQTMTIASNANTAADVISDVIDLRFNLGVFIKATFSGGQTGQIVLQGSNDQVEWVQLDSANVASGKATINKGDVFAPYIRIFKAADGAGSVTITATIKGV